MSECSNASTSLKSLLLVRDWTLLRFMYDERSPRKKSDKQVLLILTSPCLCSL